MVSECLLLICWGRASRTHKNINMTVKGHLNVTSKKNVQCCTSTHFIQVFDDNSLVFTAIVHLMYTPPLVGHVHVLQQVKVTDKVVDPNVMRAFDLLKLKGCEALGGGNSFLPFKEASCVCNRILSKLSYVQLNPKYHKML